MTQNSANYKKEEAVENKMTYPLPPISTIIGAIHSACSYKEYHQMDLSIQGRFESIQREAYTDYCFLNSIMNDRGILVKMKNANFLSSAFDKVASAKKSQGNNFREGVTIQVYNNELLNEFRALKNLKDLIDVYKKTEYKAKLNEFKIKKAEIIGEKECLDKKSSEFMELIKKEKEVKAAEKEYKENVKNYEYENYTKPIGMFRTLTTSLKYYEILNNIELIIHVKSDEETLLDIEKNIYNLKSIGRSEDFVYVEEAKIVNLSEKGKCDISSSYSAYLNYDDVLSDLFLFENSKDRNSINGTKYYLNKNYSIIDGKRIFEKKKALYASCYSIKKTSGNVFLDEDGDKNYIVNFI